MKISWSNHNPREHSLLYPKENGVLQVAERKLLKTQ